MNGEIFSVQFNVYVRNVVNTIDKKNESKIQNKMMGARNRRFTLPIKIAVDEEAFDFRNDGL